MLKRILLSAAFALGLAVAGAALAANGLSRLATAPPNALGSHDGVATFNGAMPTAAQLDGLRGLGLQVQGLSHLPLALLRGARSAMFDAVARGLAADVYPNDRLHFHSAASNLAIKANEVHALGTDGTGIGVAIIDSGIDATHPDLVNRVTHNLKIVENSVNGVQADIVVPMETTPFNNSDTSSGHGTHVAGIVAADNTSGNGMVGVAPGAHLVGYGTGEAIFVFGVITAYNNMIANRDAWKIRVVNNSWGSSFRMFDPREPINVATRAAHGAGIVVVFSAGNQSTEMSINPYSVAPWVVSTGNGTLNHQRSPTSSGGLEFDNSVLLEALPADDADKVKRITFTGDRIGLYHPSVSAPGTNILSTATTGVAVTSLPGGYASASGTSMAAPHVAGVAALMLQKRPSLTPDEVKAVLEATADLMPDTTNSQWVQPFWQVGYGYINAKAAVDLVGRHRYSQKALARLKATADRRVLGDRDESVLVTDYWAFNAAPATVSGVPDTRQFKVSVGSTTKALKGIVAYPSLGYVGQNPFNYQLTLVDASGKTIATSAPAPNAGVSKFFVDFADIEGGVTYGEWTLNVVGTGAQDQDVLMGILVSVGLHQLQPQARVSPTMPTFTATGSVTWYLTPGTAGGLASPEGCDLQAGAPVGGLSSTPGAGTCQSGAMGYAVNYGAGIPAAFTSAPLAAPLTVGGPLALRFYLVDPAQPAWTLAQNPRLVLEVDAVDANGELLLAVGATEWTVCKGAPRVCNTGPQPTGGDYATTIPPVTLPAGSRLSVLLRQTGVVSSTSRTVYGGRGIAADYSDAKITLTTGTLQ